MLTKHQAKLMMQTKLMQNIYDVYVYDKHDLFEHKLKLGHAA